MLKNCIKKVFKITAFIEKFKVIGDSYSSLGRNRMLSSLFGALCKIGLSFVFL